MNEATKDQNASFQWLVPDCFPLALCEVGVISSCTVPGICFNEVMDSRFGLGTLLALCCAFPSHGEDYAALRQKMVEEIIAASDSAPPSATVAAAMGKVERHRFVPAWLAASGIVISPFPLVMDKQFRSRSWWQ